MVLSSGRTATNCSVNNGDCDHECHESEDGLGRTCSCIKGYQLQDNSRKCIAKSKLPQQNANINNIVCAYCKYTDVFSYTGDFVSTVHKLMLSYLHVYSKLYICICGHL